MIFKLAIPPGFSKLKRRRPHPLFMIGLAIPGRRFLSPQGLSPDLHDRTRLHGEDQPSSTNAGVRSLGLASTPSTPAMGQIYRGDAGFAPEHPMIGDTDLKYRKRGAMLPAAASGDHKRTVAEPYRTQCVVIGPARKSNSFSSYPMTPADFERGAASSIDSLQLTAKHKSRTGNCKQRRRRQRRLRVRDDRKDLSAWLEITEALYLGRAHHAEWQPQTLRSFRGGEPQLRTRIPASSKNDSGFRRTRVGHRPTALVECDSFNPRSQSHSRPAHH